MEEDRSEELEQEARKRLKDRQRLADTRERVRKNLKDIKEFIEKHK